jgi:hypothetical protein
VFCETASELNFKILTETERGKELIQICIEIMFKINQKMLTEG